MTERFNTTIVAPATGHGGAIGIVRLSGADALSIISSVFKPASGSVNISTEKGYTVHYGEVMYRGQPLDDVIVTVYRAPNSYTGEDAAEVSHHASPYVQHMLVQLFTEKGAVIASPGEFTMRAFMNGRMDLSQAEAVADLIAAETESAHRLAASQLRGGISGEIEKLRQELLAFAALIELELDFSEEDVVFADRFAMTETVIRISDLVDSLRGSFRLGNAIKKGIPVVIAGRPNVGKSSLLNVLLKEERAIVSDTPGTTRDTIEEVLHLGGMLFRFIDTAGLREPGDRTDDHIEVKGMVRTRARIEAADIVLAVADATEGPSAIIDLVSEISSLIPDSSTTVIPVMNKSDLLNPAELVESKKIAASVPGLPAVFISASQEEGIEELKGRLISSIEARRLDQPQYIVTNARHFEALTKVSESLQRVLDGFRDGIHTELIATDVRQAIYFLGRITGKITPDDILGEIFSKFCIGK